MSSNPPRHWLRDVASHAGFDLALSLQPDVAELRRAWPKVVEACGLSDDGFTRRVASHFRIGVADLSTYDPQAVKLIPEAAARRYGVLPLSVTESTLVVATSDPWNRAVVREVEAYASRQPVFLMASPAKLAPAIERAYAPARASRNTLQTLVAQVAEADFAVVTNQGQAVMTTFDLEDPAVVKLANAVLQLGVKHRATEIHIEPGANQGRVRLRIDGVLQHLIDLPATAQSRLVARLRHLARKQPGVDPDAGFPIRIGSAERRAHLVTTPTPDGELVWIQLTGDEVPSLDDLGFDGPEGERIRSVLAHSDGLILVTGPARSGATDFIYAALKGLSRQSVISLEGRPELIVPGITQIRYDPDSGLTFAEALQHLLDRNPDVLHAGELRDLATARIALRTAVTGRKVLATAHTPDAVSGVRRLIDLGLAPGRLAESLLAVVSLRRVRKLCAKCSRDLDPRKDAKSREAKLARAVGVQPGKRAVGCAACAGTGYTGQIPLPEVLVMTPALRAVLSSNPGDAELLRAAQIEGMRTFAEVGLSRVGVGETTVEELERAVGIVPSREESAESIGAVLVVEDDEQDRLLLTRVLEGMGFQVRAVGDVPGAEKVLSSGEDVSLVMVDLFLPGTDGSQLLRKIRRSLATQWLPTIVVTSSSDPKHEFELLDAGADDYLVKPVSVERLESRVRAVLRRSGVRLSGRSSASAD